MSPTKPTKDGGLEGAAEAARALQAQADAAVAGVRVLAEEAQQASQPRGPNDLPTVTLPPGWKADGTLDVTLTGKLVGDYRNKGRVVVLFGGTQKVWAEIG